ncbi:MAG: hypothetical protein RL662_2514 [Bacteroidota bacterium]|jgi:small conductance mechanosensitive channel
MSLSSVLQINANVNLSSLDLLLHKLLAKSFVFGEKLIAAIAIYFVISFVISLIRKFVRRVLIRRNIDAAVASFVNSFVNVGLKIILIIIIIGVLGVETTSFAAIFAAVSLAIGMAMKDNLSNLAGGFMLLLNKPFKLGDRIIAQNMDGVVSEIGISYTVLLTADNRTIYLPNGPLSVGNIVNFSTQERRRIDITLNISNGNDADKVKELLQGLIALETKVLKEPVPFVGVTQINNSNFDVTIRLWVVASDYGLVNTSLNETIYRTLTAQGIYSNSVMTVKMLPH